MPSARTRDRFQLFKMKVVNVFQTSQLLQELPADFKVIQVSIESLKDATFRRLCRDVEIQHKLEQIPLSDRISYEERLLQILTDDLWETHDLDKTLVVLGNKSGVLSGRLFGQSGFEKLVVDHKQFSDKYPIFLDTSTVKELSGKSTAAVKRERDQTFTEAPASQRPRAETFLDMQSAWAVQESDFRRQIEDFKKKYHDAMERNIELADEATDNQQALENQIAELKSEVNNLKVTKMEQVDDDDDEDPQEVINELQRQRDELKVTLEEFMNAEKRPAQVMGMAESILEHDGDQLEYAQGLVRQLEKQNIVNANKLTLAQVGISPWNPATTAFLDYLIGFRSVMSVSKMSENKALQLLFSALPSKYSYLRGIVFRHADYDADNYSKTEALLIKMIVGGKEKIFSDFVALQKKSHESLLEYFQKVCDYYLFSISQGNNVDRKNMDTDQIAFKLIKDKMVRAFPNRMITEFKRRLESKTKLSEIVEAIIEIKDQFPDFEYQKDYSGSDLNVLRQKKSDWKKNVKCYRCGKKGHLKKECYAKREAKTKKSGSKN